MNEIKHMDNLEEWIARLVNTGMLYYATGNGVQDIERVTELVFSSGAIKYIETDKGTSIGKYPSLEAMKLVI